MNDEQMTEKERLAAFSREYEHLRAEMAGLEEIPTDDPKMRLERWGAIMMRRDAIEKLYPSAPDPLI
jgi:hypothetical protein